MRGLELRDDFRFFTYPTDTLPDLSNYMALTLDAEPLTEADASHGLFLIDGTWRYAALMFKQLPTPHLFKTRSLPPTMRTAYPRKQTDCPDPAQGLASVEALYLAYKILGRDTAGLLDNYFWKEKFLGEFGVRLG